MHDYSGLFADLTRSNQVKLNIYQGPVDMMYGEVIDMLVFG